MASTRADMPNRNSPLPNDSESLIGATIGGFETQPKIDGQFIKRGQHV